jgi:Domain of unknown function (DUF4371)
VGVRALLCPTVPAPLGPLRKDNHILDKWLNREGKQKWLDHDIQNELLQLIAHTVSREIVANVSQSKFIAIIADEATYNSGKQQLSICIRWVDTDHVVHGDFIGLYDVSTAANSKNLVKMSLDVLLRVGLDVHRLRRQYYDGASVMCLVSRLGSTSWNQRHCMFIAQCTL